MNASNAKPVTHPAQTPIHEAHSPSLPCVSSAVLLGEQREIVIDHAGVYYRLRVTRANKLILMK
ncbi:MAG: hemin uptake protein HemP [Candidatus Obscuribacterales bacterium]|nr:hemin uptake protein HemP [Steroidobacteraceae bacterium]